jgi:ATP-dependent DNA ligase
MQLPVMPPVKPMLARAVPAIQPDMLYEPKWDGFRTVVFRDGDEVELGSRNERPMTRYFPEVARAIRDNTPDRCVLDGEIVVMHDDRLDFDALLNRIHPADSRVQMLARETPASLIAFDLLALDDTSYVERPFRERRARLEQSLERAQPPVYVTPATASTELAQAWFQQFEGAGLDGVVCKPFDLPYVEDQRVMFKVKHERTADCVVAGYRWHKSGPVVGSLLLGLFDDDGQLQHVGVAASFSARQRAALVDELAPYRTTDLTGHPWGAWAAAEAHELDRLPGAVSRWNAKKDLSWVALRPELVCEVSYEHMEGNRFRHVAHFRRWRPDRDPSSCTYTQLDEPVRYELARVLGQW